MVQLEPLDIFFTRGTGWLSDAIRKATRSRGEAPTIANHVGLIGYPGKGLDAWGLEALATVKFHPLYHQYGPQSEICVFRPLNLTKQDFDLILKKAGSYVNRKYGALKLLLHAGDYLLGGRYVFRRIGRMDNYPICSYVVADSYAAAGKTFGVPTQAASPDDIWDFIVAHPDKYRFVWQQGGMWEGVSSASK